MSYLSATQEPQPKVRMIADRRHYYEGRTIEPGEAYDVLEVWAKPFMASGTAHLDEQAKVLTPDAEILDDVQVDPMTTENTSPLMPSPHQKDAKGRYTRRDMKPKP